MSNPIIEFKNDTGISFFPNGRTNNCQYTEIHTHSVIEILYFTDGLHKVICDNKEYICEVGDMLLVRSYSSHQLFSLADGSNAHYVLQIAPHFIHSIADSNHIASYLIALSFSYGDAKCLWKREENEKNGIADMFSKMLYEHNCRTSCHDIAQCVYTTGILLRILRDTETEVIGSIEKENLKRRIYDTMIFIQRNFSEDITAEECAKNVSLSPCYFSRSFRAITGRSFKEYLNLVRIIRSNQLLVTTDAPITEIAIQCGFNSTSHFIVTYKKIQNTTPLAFRKASQNI